MKVVVRLYANLRRYLPQEATDFSVKLEVEEGATVGELLKKLEIPEELTRLVFLNGLHSDPKTSLKEGDEVSVFPPLAGGLL